MSQPVFSPAVDATLRLYTVPPLPQGFSDRLLARVSVGDLPVEAEAMPVPRRRAKGFSGPWARGGRILGSVSLFGLVTAAAAASGWLGDPVYIPGVSEALARAEIIAPVEPKNKEMPKRAAAIVDTPFETEAQEVQPATGKEAVKTLVTQLRSNPEFRALPRQQRVAIARAEAIELVRSGAVTGPELRQAVREMRAEARPIIRAKFEDAVARRRAEKLAQRSPERVQQSPAEPSVAEPLPVMALATEPEADKLVDETVSAEPAPVVDTDPTREERIEDLHERYKDATPEQRARIRQRIRERTGQRQSNPPNGQNP